MTRVLPSRFGWLWLAGAILLILLATIALSLTQGAAETTSEIVLSIRAPRIAMALVVGAGLAAAGVLMQGSLRNPLADPALVGISSGAALGCVLAAVLGVGFGGLGSGLAATTGAATAMVIVVWASLRDGRPEVVTLLLSGVAIAAFAGALVSIIVNVSPDAGVRSLAFWTAGSLALANWSGVIAVVPFVLVGLIIAGTVARSLDVLSLGDRDATAAGIDVSRVRAWSLLAVVFLIGAGVAAVGVIAFLGLVIPHAVRLVIGPRTAPLLIVSTILGALVLLAADTLARTIANPVEIPVGAVTALVGAPVFFLLLRRTRASQGGWA